MLCSLNTGKFSLSGDLMHAVLLTCHTDDSVALEQVEGGSCQGPHRDWVLFEGASDWFDYRLLQIVNISRLASNSMSDDSQMLPKRAAGEILDFAFLYEYLPSCFNGAWNKLIITRLAIF